MTQPTPIERFEEISGRNMFVLEAGQGSPAVIFEAGVEDFSRAWHTVQAEIAKETRTFAYDRTGCGESDWTDSGRTCNDLALDFSALTERLGLTEPFILVAHSLGGLIARLFAARHPESLAGLVLVDSVQEDVPLLEPEIYRDMALPPRRFDEALWLTIARNYRALRLDPAFPANLQNREGIDFARSYEEVRATSGLGTLPLRVVSAGISDLHRSHGATGAVAETEAKLEQLWATCQTKLAELSSNAKHVVATDSRHYVQRDSPELVITAIRDLLELARRKN